MFIYCGFRGVLTGKSSMKNVLGKLLFFINSIQVQKILIRFRTIGAKGIVWICVSKKGLFVLELGFKIIIYFRIQILKEILRYLGNLNSVEGKNAILGT